jgi:rare lipoprotein A
MTCALRSLIRGLILAATLLPVQALACHPTATWYSYHAPRWTASGERFNPHVLTAAATWPTPLGTVLRVTAGDRSVTVRINDRMPRNTRCRKLDLTPAAFERLADLRRGVVAVKIEVVR